MFSDFLPDILLSFRLKANLCPVYPFVLRTHNTCSWYFKEFSHCVYAVFVLMLSILIFLSRNCLCVDNFLALKIPLDVYSTSRGFSFSICPFFTDLFSLIALFVLWFFYVFDCLMFFILPLCSPIRISTHYYCCR